MAMNSIDTIISIYKKALDASSMRHRVISENIANAQTPGYRARMVDFDKYMESAGNLGKTEMVRTNRNHISQSIKSGGIKIEKSKRRSRADGNNVDQDLEITRMAENTIMYKTATEWLSRKLKMLKRAIEEGGK